MEIKSEKTKLGLKRGTIVIILVILVRVVVGGISGFIEGIKKNEVAQTAFTESFITSVVENWNEDGSIEIDEELMFVNAVDLTDNRIQLNWKLYTYTKSELDLEKAEEILQEDFKYFLGEMISKPEWFKKQQIYIVNSVLDKEDSQIFDIIFSPDDY